MKIHPNIEIVDLGLFLIKQKTLVFSDFHIGFEEALNKQGVLLPRFQFKDMMLRLEKIVLAIKKPETIIINGDVKHEFGRISEQEWRESLKMIDFLSRHCSRLIMTRGNHDKVLGPIAKKRNIEIVDYFVADSILITHGDKIISRKQLKEDYKKIKTIIIGHEHPAISLREGAKTEKYKCFLRGRHESRDLIVQPSFNLVTEGTDVSEEETLSPYLKGKRLKDFLVWIIADKVYEFGKVSNVANNTVNI
jgi:putative SbcD/Mre11-related phosphoesterase